MKTKKQMIDYIDGHFKYWLMNPWNKTQGYALNVKIYNMGFDKKTTDKIYDFLCVDEFYANVSYEILDFEIELNETFGTNISIGFNGRSSGYVVLYKLLSDNMADQTIDRDWLESTSKECVKSYYDLLRYFDKLKARLKMLCVGLAKQYNVVEKVIEVPKTVKILQEVG